MKKWREWDGLESGANKTLKYHDRIYRKDIPDDEEKLMTNMINQMNYKKNKREEKDKNYSQYIGKYVWEGF